MVHLLLSSVVALRHFSLTEAQGGQFLSLKIVNNTWAIAIWMWRMEIIYII